MFYWWGALTIAMKFKGAVNTACCKHTFCFSCNTIVGSLRHKGRKKSGAKVRGKANCFQAICDVTILLLHSHLKLILKVRTVKSSPTHRRIWKQRSSIKLVCTSCALWRLKKGTIRKTYFCVGGIFSYRFWARQVFLPLYLSKTRQFKVFYIRVIQTRYKWDFKQ